MLSQSNLTTRRSIRLQGYDYSQEGLYFVTMCCYKRMHLFGEITGGKLILNEAGKFANQCWIEIPNHFPNAVLHEYIIMPNHVHGIIELVGAAAAEAAGAGAGAENFLPLLPQPSPPPQPSRQKNEFQKSFEDRC